MAFSVGDPCVQVAPLATLSGRLARHQRLRLRDPELYGHTVTAISEQAVSYLPTRPLRGAGADAVACDQGSKGASGGGRRLIVACWVRGRKTRRIVGSNKVPQTIFVIAIRSSLPKEPLSNHQL